MIRSLKYFFLGLLVFIFNSCTEPFDIASEIDGLDSILVVEGMVTNEFKQHEVLLSRTFSLQTENDSIPDFFDTPRRETNPESNANVRVIDDLQNEFIFSEAVPGTYVSDVAFSAESDRTYQLFITTAGGEEYNSTEVNLPSTGSQIEDIKASLAINSDGEEGVRITVSSFDPIGNSRLYRYEFEETYRLTAPFWSPLEAVIISENPPDVEVRLKTGIQNRVCYPTNFSENIALTNTNTLAEDRVLDFEVRFINRNDAIVADRYSILVRQFTQSLEAHMFYETLQQFSSSETLFVETQPGFVVGNITSADGESPNVLGFFEMVSVTEGRIFFNRDEIFIPRFPIPDFPFAFCPQESVSLIGPGGTSPLITRLNQNFLFFTFLDNNTISSFNSLVVVPGPCGDCTFFGTNIVPDFWID